MYTITNVITKEKFTAETMREIAARLNTNHYTIGNHRRYGRLFKGVWKIEGEGKHSTGVIADNRNSEMIDNRNGYRFSALELEDKKELCARCILYDMPDDICEAHRCRDFERKDGKNGYWVKCRAAQRTKADTKLLNLNF